MFKNTRTLDKTNGQALSYRFLAVAQRVYAVEKAAYAGDALQ
jgi:hypothetical protein